MTNIFEIYKNHYIIPSIQNSAIKKIQKWWRKYMIQIKGHFKVVFYDNDDVDSNSQIYGYDSYGNVYMKTEYFDEYTSNLYEKEQLPGYRELFNSKKLLYVPINYICNMCDESYKDYNYIEIYFDVKLYKDFSLLYSEGEDQIYRYNLDIYNCKVNETNKFSGRELYQNNNLYISSLEQVFKERGLKLVFN